MALNIMLQLFRFEEGRLKDWLKKNTLNIEKIKFILSSPRKY